MTEINIKWEEANAQKKKAKCSTLKNCIMKLNKFSMQKMSVAEMSAIKAGSGTCSTGSYSCSSDTKDRDGSMGDSDRD